MSFDKLRLTQENGPHEPLSFTRPENWSPDVTYRRRCFSWIRYPSVRLATCIRQARRPAGGLQLVVRISLDFNVDIDAALRSIFLTFDAVPTVPDLLNAGVIQIRPVVLVEAF